VAAEILLADVNRHGTAQAIVEADGRAVYVYVRPAEPSLGWMHATWLWNEADVRGRRKVDIRKQMKKGLAPMVPAEDCRWPEERARPSADDLRLVWWPAGDGVFLLVGGTLVAVVPPWADSTCPGYSVGALASNPMAWPLDGTALPEALADAEAFWRPERLEFAPLQAHVMGAVEAAAGPSIRYWQVDGGKWPLCGASLHRPAGRTGPSLAVTVGMSLVPMPSRGMEIDAIELAVCARGDDEGCARLLSSFARYPWEGFTWLDAGHTLTCDPVRPSTWRHLDALLVPAGDLPPLEALGEIALPHDRSAKLLVLVPITAEERALAVEAGSETLLARLASDEPWWFVRG
jgi:hypothetical protein